MIAPIIMQFEAVVSATPLDLHKSYGNDLEHPEDDVVIGNNLITVENVCCGGYVSSHGTVFVLISFQEIKYNNLRFQEEGVTCHRVCQFP